MSTRIRPSATGFTGFELLIVIALVGLLAWLVVSRFGDLAVVARDTERRLDVNILAAELETFHADQGYYPPYVESLSIFPQTTEDGQQRLSPDAIALIDPSGRLVVASPTASTNIPASGYSQDQPEGGQYTYAPYSCSLAPNPEASEEAPEETEADQTEASADETGAEATEEEAADETEADSELFSECQKYVIYAWLEGGTGQKLYFKAGRN